MTPDRRWPRGGEAARAAGRSFCAALALVAGLPGCTPPETRVDVLSFKDPGRLERFSERFTEAWYCQNADHTWTIVLAVGPAPITDASPATQPAGSRELRGPAVKMSQIVQIEVFWKPRPGTTHAEKSQTNASITYGLMVGKDVITYEGAGFVYFRPSWDGRQLVGSIESGTLYPARTLNQPEDFFGPCHVQGRFFARQNRARVQTALREWRRRLGPPLAVPGGGGSPGL